MANSVNSNGKKINGHDARVEEILRAETGKSQKSIELADQNLKNRLNNIANQRIMAEQSGEDLVGNADYAKILNAPKDADAAYNSRLEEIERSKRAAQSKQIATLGRRARVDRDVTHMAQGAEAYMSGATNESLMMSSTYRQAQISSLKEKIEYGMSSLSTMAVNGASEKDILAASGNISSYRKQAAALERGGKEATLKGLSEDRMIKKAEKIEEEHIGSRANQELRQKAMSGGMGDLSKVTKDYENSIQEMSESNEKLKALLKDEIAVKETSLLSEKQRLVAMADVANKISEAKEDLADATRRSENAATVKEAVKNAPSTWDAKFGAGTKFGGAMMLGAAGVQLAMNMGAGYKEFAHDSEMRKGSANASVIDATNDLYFKSKQAIMQSDVGAALDVMDSVTAARYADDQAKHTMLPNFTSGAGKMVLAGIGAAAATGMAVGSTAMATLVGAPIGAPIVAVSAAVGAGVGMLASSGGVIDSVNGTAGIKDRLEAYNTMKNLSAADRAVRTDQMQAYYSHGNRMYDAVQGLGGGGADLQRQLMYFEENTPVAGLDVNKAGSVGTYFNPSMGATTSKVSSLDELAGVGIDEVMAAKLTPMFGAAGSFRGSDAFDVMKMAGTANQKGILGQEQYVGLASQLMGAGGGAGDLQKTLEFAVAKGMDSSKSISEMVQASLSMSSDLADMGIAGTASSSAALMKTIEGLNPAIQEDKNLAIRAAQSSLISVNQQMKDRSINIGNLVEMDMLNKSLQGTGIGIRGKESIAGMGTTEMEMLNLAKQGDVAATASLRAWAEERGVDNAFFKDDGKGEIDTGRVNEIQRASESMILNKIDTTKEGRYVHESVQNKLEQMRRGEKAEPFTRQEKELYGKDLAALGAAAKGAKTPEDLAAMSKTFQEKKNLEGSGADVTKAQASAEIVKLGQEFAKTLTDSNASAFKKIDALMEMLKEQYIAPGAERSKQSGDTGKIVADLTNGASQFKSIIEATAKRANDLGMKVDIVPVSSKEVIMSYQPNAGPKSGGLNIGGIGQ